jgi:hypothetical protein
VVAAVEEDVAVEVGMVAFEGMAGLPAFLGNAASPHRAFCQIPGQALRLQTVALRRFLAGGGALHDLLHRYTQAVMVFLAQNLVCNRLHSAEERTARWLAQTHDRVGSDSFQITQEFLAQMLGVRRGCGLRCGPPWSQPSMGRRRWGCQLLCLRREVLLVRAEVRDLCRLPVAAGGWS